MGDGATSGAPRIGLLRLGDRPRLNARLGRLLGETFPGHAVDDIDVLDDVQHHRLAYTAAAASALAEYAVPLARRSLSVRNAVVRSRPFARRAATVARTSFGPRTHRFTFQSQSLFDGSVPGIPHFVYTDHAHLANLTYPAYDPRDLAPSCRLRMEVSLYRSAAAVFVRSRHVRDVLVHGYGCPPDRVIVVGVGPNAPPPEGPVRREWAGGRILFVGIDWQRKGGDVALAAFARIRERHPTAELHIVGCRPPGVAGAGVHVHGRVGERDVTRLALDCDVFCLPTRIEPFGVAFIEAMHAGLPVVGTDLGAIPDFTIPGRTGELVAPDDVDALVATLDRLLAEPDRTLQMGANARDLARAHYDWAPVMAAIRDHIDALLPEPTLCHE